MSHERLPGETASGEERTAPTNEDVRAYLAAQDKESLVDMIMRRAVEDEHLFSSIRIKAARGKPGGVDLEACRAALRGAIEVDGFISYQEVYDYKSGVDEAVDLVAGLLKDSYPSEAIALCEYGLLLIEDALQCVNHSCDLGYYSERLQDIHHAACRKARPDPKELSGHLFQWELTSDLGVFHNAAERYSDVLGKKGLIEYRGLAETAWTQIPALGPGDDDRLRYDGKRSRITSIMEGLARLDGDIDELVEVKKRDLSSQYEFLEIAEVYKQARMHDQALEWAERGLEAFPERPDSRLREFLAQEYQRRGRHDEAMDMVWEEFAESPHLDRYRNLKSHAARLGQWPAWREKALGFMRERTVEAQRELQKSRWSGYRPADHSELVKVFLWEKEVEAAWSEAVKGGCSDDLWMRLAELREKEHPEDSLRVYIAQVDPLINQKNNDSYREAVRLLRKIRAVMERLGRGAEFAPYITTVRVVHGRKRNLMKLLEHEKWE